MGERRGDGMTAFKTAMNNYQSSLQTNTKTVLLFCMNHNDLPTK
jgi:hypothetical protein